MQTQNKTYNNEPGITWEDVHFTSLLKLGDARREGRLKTFKDALRFFETTLNHRKDGLFEETFDNLEYNFSYEDLAENDFLDYKADALTDLLARSTEKQEDLTEYSSESEVIKKILRQIKTGTGQNIMATGMPGSGKSWSCLTMAVEITKVTGKPFDPNVHIVFTLDEFWKLYNDQELCPPGSVIIFEEVGVNVNSKQFMSKTNVFFGKVFQTMRYRGIAVMLNTPSLGFLDKTPRSLLHWHFSTKSLNRKKGYCEMKPKMVEIDQQTGQLYFPFSRLRDHQRITRLRVTKPPEDIIKVYEKRAKEFKDNLGKELAQLMTPESEIELTPIEKEYLVRRSAGELQKVIMSDLGLSKPRASKLEKKLKLRGLLTIETRGQNGFPPKKEEGDKN